MIFDDRCVLVLYTKVASASGVLIASPFQIVKTSSSLAPCIGCTPTRGTARCSRNAGTRHKVRVEQVQSSTRTSAHPTLPMATCQNPVRDAL